MDMTNTERDLVSWLKSEVGFTFYPTSVAMSAPSGRPVQLLRLGSHDLVDCSSYSSTLDTMERIISEAMYAGLPAPSRPEACAAAFSVPDGATIAQAVDNLGCAISDAAATQMHTWAQHNRAMRRRFG